MAVLAFYAIVIALKFISVASDPVIVASSPNLMRVGNEETVLVSLHNREEAVDVTVKLKLFENGDEGVISESVVSVGADAVRAVLYVNPDLIPSVEAEEELQRFAYITVICPELGFEETKQVLLSYEEGFLFIQTDKPVYTPNQSVKIRVISLTQYLTPSSQEVQLDIVTPHDVIVKSSTFEENELRNGILSNTFFFHQDPMFGHWKIVAHYGKDMSANKTVEFEVKGYVLPTFSVKIQAPAYILPTDESITIRVESRYVYDKAVRGRCFMKVGVQEEDEEPVIHHTQGALLDHGAAQIEIGTDLLGEDWFEENVGKSLYIDVTVVEDATGHFENASDISAKFLRSPYTFTFERTMRYFKKGLPYEVKTVLKFMNGNSAPGVRVKVIAAATMQGQQNERLLRGAQQNPGDGGGELEPTEDDTNEKGQVYFRLYVPRQCTNIRISLETVVPELIGGGENPINNNARLEFNIGPFESPDGNEFLVLRVPNQVIRPQRESLNVDVFLNSVTGAPVVHYFVIARGKLMAYGKRAVANVDGFSFPVSYEMVPSARIVAYYISDNNDIIADSIWIEIARECENPLRVTTLNVEFDPIGQDPITPRAHISLRVRGTPGTSVALLAIDKAVLILRDYHRLTPDKMYGSMDEHDTGCGPGGGRNSGDIFMNAGLMVLTNLNLDVPRREGPVCAVSAENNRRKRSLDLTDPQFIVTNPSEVLMRTDSRESWAFDIVEIPNDRAFVDRIYSVPESITTWSLQAFGLHENEAMCVHNPVDLLVFNILFIQLHMPYSVVRKEFVEIQATVFNYADYDLVVQTFMEVPHEICSEGTAGKLSARKEFIVQANDARTITYMVVGLETGELPIKVAALTPSSSDTVIKMLRVEDEVKYNELAGNDDTECAFDLEITTRRIIGEERTPFVKDDKVRVRVCASYKGAEQTSMAILDVGLYSGFAPVSETLRNLVNDDGLIDRTEMSGRSVIFYVDHIPVEGDGPLCFEFEAVCEIVVGNLQNAAVHVYDYYNPECTKLYAPEGTNLIGTLCSNTGMCSCVSGKCAACSGPLGETEDDLLEIVCDSIHTYVYKVEVRGIEESNGFGIIEGMIERVIKRGDDLDIYENLSRKFWVSSSCECPGMRIGRKYMVIGRNYLRYEDEGGWPGFKYIIDHTATVRPWRKGRKFKYLQRVQDRIIDGQSNCG